MERKIVNVFITPRFIESVMQTSDPYVAFQIEGLPRGSRLVNIAFDFNVSMFCATFEHYSFDHVEEGAIVPVKNIIIHKMNYS